MMPTFAIRSIRAQKSFVVGLLLGMILVLPGVAVAQNDLKVATVDVAKIFKRYARTKELDARIEEARHSYGNGLDERMQHHHELVEELSRIDRAWENAALGASERSDLLKKREINVAETSKLEGEINDFKVAHESALREMAVRARTEVVEEIMVIINARVERDHDDLVVNQSAQGKGPRPVVLYANGALDITEDVIATLNRNHPPAPGPAPGGLP